jgi:hypothetical protein
MAKNIRFDLPVEVWQRGAEWTFGVPTTSEIKEVSSILIKNFLNGTGIIIPGRKKLSKNKKVLPQAGLFYEDGRNRNIKRCKVTEVRDPI